MPNPFGKSLAQEEPVESKNPFSKNKESDNPFGRQASASEPIESRFPPLPKSSISKKKSFVDNVVDLAKHSGTQAKANFSALLATGQWDSFDEGVQNQLVDAISVASKAHQQPEELERYMATVGREAEDVGDAWTKGEYGNAALQSLDFLGEVIYEGITNPKGFAYANAEQAANLAATWAPGIALGKLGAVSGATIGAVGGPAGAGTGAMVGGAGGFLMGAGMGSYMIETGAQIREFIQAQGGDPSDSENIRKALDNPQLRDEILSNASKKGLSIATFDAVANLLGLKLLKGATGPASFIKRGIGAESAQIAGAAGGEIVGQQLATGEVQAAEVGQEVALEMGPGGVADIALTAHAARKREVGKKLPEAEETPLDAVDLIGDVEKPDVEVTEKPIAQPAEAQPQEAGGTQDLTGSTPGIGVPETAQEPIADAEPIVSYFDNRLNRDIYRNRLEGMSEELAFGGGNDLVQDPNFVAGESDPRDANGVAIVPMIRPPSNNPEWFVQLMEDDHYSMTVENVQSAIKKAVSGERLGVRQARVIGAMLEHVTGERTSDQEMDYARNQLRIAREARAAAKMPDAQDWLLEEEDYAEDMDGVARTLLEFQEQAKGLSAELAEQVDELLYSDTSDADIISNVQKLFGDYYGRQSQASTQAYQEPEAGAGLPGAEPITQPRIPAAAEQRPAEPAGDQYARQRELPAETGLVEQLPPIADVKADKSLKDKEIIKGPAKPAKPVKIGKKSVAKQVEDLNLVDELTATKDRRQKKKPGLKKERRSKDADKRRRDWAYRKEVDAMSEKEKSAVIGQLRQDALINQLTGLGSRMAWEDIEKKKYILSIDADSLKYVNDALGNKAGDALLVATGKAIKTEFPAEDEAAHTSGDEFWAHSDSKEHLENGAKRALESLKDKTASGPGGEITGLGFSYGVAENEGTADRKMKADKQTRTDDGLRVERGERPDGIILKGEDVAEIWKGTINGQDAEINTKPTDEQIEAGNYQKAHINVQGLKVSIETPAGVKRRPEWPAMGAHYGYIRDTIGADSETGAAPHEIEQVDISVNPDVEVVPDDNPIYIINQYIDGKFDEVKVQAGFATSAVASKSYMAGYTKGWKGLNSIHKLTIDEFKSWLDTGDMNAEYIPKDLVAAKQKPGPAKQVAGKKPTPKAPKLPDTGITGTQDVVKKPALSIGERRNEENKTAVNNLKSMINAPGVTHIGGTIKGGSLDGIIGGVDEKGVKKPDLEPVPGREGFRARQYMTEGQPRQEIMSPNGNIATRGLDSNGIYYDEMEGTLDDLLSGKVFNDFNDYFSGKQPAKVEKQKQAKELTAPKDLSANNYAILNGKKISYDVEIEDTGETVKYTEDSGEAMRAIDVRIDNLKALLDCI